MGSMPRATTDRAAQDTLLGAVDMRMSYTAVAALFRHGGRCGGCSCAPAGPCTAPTPRF